MNRLKKFLTDTADSLLRVALRYPVEAALCIYACIFGAIQIEWSFDYHMLLAADGAATEMRQLPDGVFTMLPLTMLATLIVHTLVGRASRAWRTLYLLVPLLLTIASWLLGKEWFGTSQFFITSAVLAPLGLLMGPPHPAQRTVRTTNVGIHSRCGRRRDLRADGHALRDGHLPLGHLHLQYPGVMGSP